MLLIVFFNLISLINDAKMEDYIQVAKQKTVLKTVFYKKSHKPLIMNILISFSLHIDLL